MSLINQMLTDLEKRGATTSTNGVSVRPVYVQQRSRNVILPTLIVLLLAGMAAGLWVVLRDLPPPSSPSPNAPNQAALQTPAVPVLPPRIHAGSDQRSLTSPKKKKVVDRPVITPKKPVLRAATPPPDLRRDQLQTPFERALALTKSVEAAKPAAGMTNNTKRQNISGKAAPVIAGSPEPVKEGASPSDTSVPGIDKKDRQVTVDQQAENEYRKANGLMQQGRSDEAIAGYRSALILKVGHEAARQAMVGLLLERKRNNDAEQALREGLDYNPKQSHFAMLLARLQVDRNELPQALQTLQTTLPYAGQLADYQAFVAAVQQRLGRHKEAIDHYQSALRLSPNSGVWLMGLGISLLAEKRNEDARAVFSQALDSRSLNQELQSFVVQRLRELGP